jgi:hypothetical protein
MAGALMVCEQGLVQLGLAQKASGFYAMAYLSLALSRPDMSGCLHSVSSEVYVIGKPLCPV